VFLSLPQRRLARSLPLPLFEIDYKKVYFFIVEQFSSIIAHIFNYFNHFQEKATTKPQLTGAERPGDRLHR
jgi:hypothetical protein